MRKWDPVVCRVELAWRKQPFMLGSMWTVAVYLLDCNRERISGIFAT